MRPLKLLLFTFIIFPAQSLIAQDIHWTLYDMSPLTINPANTGAFEGTYRVGGIYRDQFNGISGVTGFRTPSVYADAPIVRGFRKKDWVGVGGVFYNDEAGSAALNTTGTFASVAYHFALNEKGTMHLTFGVQGGFIQRRIDPLSQSLIFEDEVLNGGTSPNREILDENKLFADLNTGLILSGKLNEKTSGRVGLAFKHLNRGSYNLNPTQAEQLPVGITVHADFDYRLSEKTVLSPGILFNNIQSMNEGLVRALVGYHFSEDLTVRAGAGYRFGDAFAPMFRLDYKRLKVGVSYDMTLSELSDINNRQGAFEIGVWYVIRQYKKPEAKPVIFCPEF